MGMPDRPSPFGPASTVQLSGSNIARRFAKRWTGIHAETIVITHRMSFEYRASSPSHMLILTEHGSRYDGETMIEGAVKSTLRDFSPRLSFVPVGHRYCGWQKPRVLTRVTYLHIDPAGPLLDPELRFSEIEFTPRLFFQDRDLWQTALKLESQIESPVSRAYAEALGVVLAHELIRVNDPTVAPRAPGGGLAGWQQRRLNEYISARSCRDRAVEPFSLRSRLQAEFRRSAAPLFPAPSHRVRQNASRKSRPIRYRNRAGRRLCRSGLLHGGVPPLGRDNADGLSPCPRMTGI
jgi:AraC family transcriptional regulator